MPARDKVPTYRLHKQSGQAVVTLPLGGGQRRDVMLGPYKSKESRLEYARIIAEWEAAGRTLPPEEGQADLTIAELLVRFLTWARGYHRGPDGKPGEEYGKSCSVLNPLKRLTNKTIPRRHRRGV